MKRRRETEMVQAVAVGLTITALASTIVPAEALGAPVSTASTYNSSSTPTPAVPANEGTLIGGQVTLYSASICEGGIDWPHISGTKGVTYTVNTHLDGVCRGIPSAHSIEGSLYRSRWYGWEHLTSGRVSKATPKLHLYLNKKCNPGDWYKYRASGRFYAMVGKTRWSRSFYNQNQSEFKCVRSPGSSS